MDVYMRYICFKPSPLCLLSLLTLSQAEVYAFGTSMCLFRILACPISVFGGFFFHTMLFINVLCHVDQGGLDHNEAGSAVCSIKKKKKKRKARQTKLAIEVAIKTV